MHHKLTDDEIRSKAEAIIKQRPEFALVERYPRHLINRDGQVLSVISGVIMKPKVQGIGYRSVTIYRDDIKKQTPTLIHRLVALAFVNNPNPDKYRAVNHINGIKHDNRAENLEWTDVQGNSLHALRTGLIKSLKCFYIYNNRTGKAARLGSVLSADAYMGVPRNTIYRILLTPNIAQADIKHFTVAIDTGQDSILLPNGERISCDEFETITVSGTVAVYDIHKKEISFYDSPHMAAAFINVGEATIASACSTKRNWPIKGYLFRWRKDAETIDEHVFTEAELKAFSYDVSGIQHPILEHDSQTGKETVYVGLSDLLTAHAPVAEHVVISCLRKHRMFKNRYQFTYIKE